MTRPQRILVIAGLLLIATAGAVVACLTGCASSITPPCDPANPVSVFLLDYGRHSSLAFPTDAEHTLVEYAYGDWDWFALDESEWDDVFPTLFWPTQGALGRRVLCVEPTPASVLQASECEVVLEITVSGCAVTDLTRELDGRFDERLETLHSQPLYQLAFVHTDKPFHLFHNCNHAVAEWLRKVGCQVRGPTVLADFSLASGSNRRAVQKPSPHPNAGRISGSHRWLRARRGLCPACAYPVGTSSVCTECGSAVRPATPS